MIVRFTPGATTFRPFLHRARGVKIGKGVFIADDVYIDGEYPEMVEIQEGAAVSIRATIIAHNKGPGRVIIEKGALIGPQAVVLCSSGKILRIGEGAVVGAGCVVSRNVPARTVLIPAPNQVAGHAMVSLVAAETIEEFWAGLRPLPRKPATSQSNPGVRVVDDSPGQAAD
ncbi:MAG: acyltransferase [Dongiaceae bacterium]